LTGRQVGEEFLVHEVLIERMIDSVLDLPSIRDVDWVTARFGHR
jgi:hypothetical protein